MRSYSKNLDMYKYFYNNFKFGYENDHKRNRIMLCRKRKIEALTTRQKNKGKDFTCLVLVVRFYIGGGVLCICIYMF